MVHTPKRPFSYVLIQYFAILMVAFSISGMSGCATDPNLGMAGGSRADVLRAYGNPTGSFRLPGGERLQYSRQPYGQQVINFDLDAQGKVVTVRQTMTPAEFALVELDAWRTADVERAFGKPPIRGQVYSFKGEVWSYRYDDYGNPKQFHLFIDPQGVVRRTQSTDEIQRRERDL
jgi:hypothetical protein